MIKSSISMMLLISVLLNCVIHTYAADLDTEHNVDDEIILESIMMGEEIVTIPAIVHNTERIAYMKEGGNETRMCTREVTHYIPVTEEGKNYNKTYIESVQSSNSVYGGNGTSIIEKPDSNNYFKATTYVNYTLYDDSVGGSDFYIGINSVAITRNRNPEGSGGYLLGIETPSVYVRQWGAALGGGETFSQEMTATLIWGTEGKSVPSSWRPVARGPYCYCWGEFTFSLIYSTGTVNCSITNRVN